MKPQVIALTAALAVVACDRSNPTTTTTTTGATPEAPPAGNTVGQPINVSNPRVNEHDRQGTILPTDQGNTPAEIAITMTVRNAVVGDDTLSFTAKNVKIVTVGSKVTLRGLVNNALEKSEIENIAKRTAGVAEVDNELEVKP